MQCVAPVLVRLSKPPVMSGECFRALSKVNSVVWECVCSLSFVFWHVLQLHVQVF
jgi:hypothetical protein